MSMESFGELLKAFRTRRHLTQQQLADKLELHRNTIGIWERGAYLPESKAVILELVRHLHLADHEARQILEASLTGLAPLWQVPYPHNPLFTGREQILEMVHTSLHAQPGAAYALQGLGGIGKTQIALEYAYRYALEHSAICWIAAETGETLISSLVQVAEALQLPERQELDRQRLMVAVQRWLATHDQWLLIWDNLEDLDLLLRYLPSTRLGAVLITTRRQALGPQVQGVNLAPMDLEEGRLLLLRRAKVLGLDASAGLHRHPATCSQGEDAAARELVIRFGGLPLALDQAGAYCDETGCSVQDYLRRYDQYHAVLLGRRGSPGEDHPHSVTTTIYLAMEQVERRMPAAADMLRVCAVLYAEAIPDEILVDGAAHLGPLLSPLAGDLTAFDQAIAVLRSLSLVHLQPTTRMIAIHRLVQTVLIAQMSESEHTEWLRRVVAALNQVAPRATIAGWNAVQQSERFLPHLLAVTAVIPDHAGNPDVVEVLQKAASYLHRRAEYSRAEALYQRAIRMGEQTPGTEQILVAIAVTGLGVLYLDQGKYAQVEPLYRRALAIWERETGPDHPAVATLLANLAVLYDEQGQHERAEPLFHRTVTILEHTYGPDHLHTAVAFTNLADCYTYQEKYAQAEPLYHRALAIWEQEGEQLYAADALNGLARIATAQGNSREAERLLQQALAIREQTLGPEHPETAQTLYDLAVLRRQQGRQSEALAHAERALKIRTTFLGDAHPKTVATRTLYAQLLRERGYVEEEGNAESRTETHP